jgi:hypothetical protein
MAQNDLARFGIDESLGPPMERFSTKRFVRKEKVLKQEIESYYVSDVENIAIIHTAKRKHTIAQVLDMPDALITGLTYKQRLICTKRGDCLLLARWKPDRHMRRNAPDWSQKWFVEKQLYPPDNEKLFLRLGKRFQELADGVGAGPPAATEEAEAPEAAATAATEEAEEAEEE